MALCLGASLVDKGSLIWEDVAKRWVQWYTEGLRLSFDSLVVLYELSHFTTGYMSAIGRCFDIGQPSYRANLHGLIGKL